MRWVAVAALAGVLFAAMAPPIGTPVRAAVPGLLVCTAAGLACFGPRWLAWRLLLALLVAALAGAYTSATVSTRLAARLPANWALATVRAEGRVVGLPEPTGDGSRFLFRPERLHGVIGPIPTGLLLRVNCRGPHTPRPGERWQLALKLRAARGMVNPGVFDYEAWLFAQGIGGLAHCVAEAKAERLPDSRAQGLAAWRAEALASLRRALGTSSSGAIIAALCLGEDSGIGPAAWAVLRITGTIHLVSVSGLHVSCIARVVTGLFAWLAGRVRRGGPSWSITLAAELLGLFTAAVYAALAGFGIPVLRALTMLVVYSLANLSGWPYAATQVLALALLAVLAWDPLAVLSQGFWLSFLAVWVLLVLSRPAVSGRSVLLMVLHAQVALTFALAPALFIGGLGLAPAGLLANPLVVPWVTLLTTPIALSGLLLYALGLPGDGLCWWFAEVSLKPAWWLLDLLARQAGTVWQPAHPRLGAALLALLAVVLGLLPRGLGLHGPALLAAAALLLPAPPRLAPGEFVLTVLDVGQGTAVAIETARHTLVYDTGPRYSERLEAGAGIIAPYLVARGRRRIDLLVVSHADADHAGGLLGLVEALPVAALQTALPEALPVPGARPCVAGQRWHWDGIEFLFLHPAPQAARAGNNGSCVLRLVSPYGRVLLPGDVEAAAESRLLSTAGADLQSEFVLAPHHGSRTSSSPAWVRAVKAREVVYSVGHANRYGFPHAVVDERWRASGARASDTARHGALVFRFLRSGLERSASRCDQSPYWRWQDGCRP